MGVLQASLDSPRFLDDCRTDTLVCKNSHTIDISDIEKVFKGTCANIVYSCPVCGGTVEFVNSYEL